MGAATTVADAIMLLLSSPTVVDASSVLAGWLVRWFFCH